MANQDLINYIKQVREQGVSDKEIKKTLLEQGWTEGDVNEGLKSILSKTVQAKQPVSPAGGPIKKPKPKWLLPVIVIVGIIVLGVGVWAGYNYWLKPGPPEEEEAAPSDFIEESKIPEAPEEIVDCGEIGPDNLDPTGERQSCFEAKFKECKLAKFIISIDLGPLGGLTSNYYEIIGPSDNLCAVKSKYLKVLNPEWVNKEMACRYDNSMEFEEAIKDMSNCQGELYNLINPPLKTMLYKGVSVTDPRLSLKIGFLGKRDSKYILSVEHTQNASCGKKEILLSPDGSYSCDGKSYIFKLDAAGSDDNQITFSTQVQKEE